jgi:TPR repeat protein
MVSLGALFIQGDGLPSDIAEGIRLYNLAAEQESPEAQMRLGNMYEHGVGFRQDSLEAVRWYTLAIQQGNANAQFCLGLMLFHGRGVPKDVQKASELMQLAADVGHPHAAAFLHRLGICAALSMITFCAVFFIRNLLKRSENPVPKTVADVVLNDQFQDRDSKQHADGPLDKIFACCRMRV